MNNDSLRRDGLYHEQCGRTYTARHAADGLSTRVSCEVCHVEVRVLGPEEWAALDTREREQMHMLLERTERRDRSGMRM